MTPLKRGGKKKGKLEKEQHEDIHKEMQKERKGNFHRLARKITRRDTL